MIMFLFNCKTQNAAYRVRNHLFFVHGITRTVARLASAGITPAVTALRDLLSLIHGTFSARINAIGSCFAKRIISSSFCTMRGAVPTFTTRVTAPSF